MSAIGALETVALTQVYRHGPTLPVSDYPNLSATTIVRRMIGERLMLCRVRLMAHESSNCVGFQRGTPSHQGQTTEDDSSHATGPCPNQPAAPRAPATLAPGPLSPAAATTRARPARARAAVHTSGSSCVKFHTAPAAGDLRPVAISRRA